MCSYFSLLGLNFILSSPFLSVLFSTPFFHVLLPSLLFHNSDAISRLVASFIVDSAPPTSLHLHTWHRLSPSDSPTCVKYIAHIYKHISPPYTCTFTENAYHHSHAALYMQTHTLSILIDTVIIHTHMPYRNTQCYMTLK